MAMEVTLSQALHVSLLWMAMEVTLSQALPVSFLRMAMEVTLGQALQARFRVYRRAGVATFVTLFFVCVLAP